nr:immunoglobulin light chain junction region [Macaca mulatta]MOW14254.1 immunoglobulin light chain junction region [Macaca mulatta]
CMQGLEFPLYSF